jgi:hypothetical protein
LLSQVVHHYFVSKTKKITVYCEENGGDVPVKVATPGSVLEGVVLQLLGEEIF